MYAGDGEGVAVRAKTGSGEQQSAIVRTSRKAVHFFMLTDSFEVHLYDKSIAYAA
jgi:hypothetical protein